MYEISTTILKENGTMQVRYFVTEPALYEDIPIPQYGIGITDGVETHTVGNFCSRKEEAIAVANILCRGKVTPVSFLNVLEDYLSEK